MSPKLRAKICVNLWNNKTCYDNSKYIGSCVEEKNMYKSNCIVQVCWQESQVNHCRLWLGEICRFAMTRIVFHQLRRPSFRVSLCVSQSESPICNQFLVCRNSKHSSVIILVHLVLFLSRIS